MLKKIGPGILVAAAFVGPGTITICTIAGVEFGFALIWALVVSILCTIILQEMAGRIGVVTQKGLVNVIGGQLTTKWTKNLVLGIVLAAILIGNAAYEAGNIGGATLGLNAIFEMPFDFPIYPLLIGFLAFAILWFGSYKSLEKMFMGLVGVMGLCFVIAAFITKPSFSEMLKGAFLPSLPKGSLLTIVALVGTTVVPYNLFLHASLVKEKWSSEKDLSFMRWDTVVSVGVGGLVSIAIIVTAAATDLDNVANAVDMAKSMEPLFGKMALYFMGLGLLLAGITSAITAPLAAAYVASSCFGWRDGMRDSKFRLIWISILFLGVFFLSFDIKPIQVIQFAQVANGILLPVMAILLLWMVNQRKVMGDHVNKPFQNSIAVLIVLFAIFLGVKSIFKVLEFF
ncbi:Nramp family divalent metal transporter [Flagellimonas meridianipacifica]|uniref:NRAMP (Natural resistance-associated macrophage protein)-like metal ion transporter n=1 Tax=Flagellimonas meridianipacifica TaxID=1080225 RepID=A0A2T0MB20_9FLAO|nr:Nramp family divalent metal transporter [Allomuricauda pacifica]PRX54704.1 NRAMP (natural resistance-associated macrophage protein)-like metal ion transporter [Allomuricauda pacifica]